MTLLQQFAEQYNLQFQTAIEEADELIPGGRGSIYFQGKDQEQQLAVHITKNWNHAKSILVQLGCEVIQRGDMEGVLTFNHLDKEQSQKAIQFARCHPRIAKVILPFRPIRNTQITGAILTAAQLAKISLPLRPVKGAE